MLRGVSMAIAQMISQTESTPDVGGAEGLVYAPV
jgi:hypothetical protein